MVDYHRRLAARRCVRRTRWPRRSRLPRNPSPLPASAPAGDVTDPAASGSALGEQRTYPVASGSALREQPTTGLRAAARCASSQQPGCERRVSRAGERRTEERNAPPIRAQASQEPSFARSDDVASSPARCASSQQRAPEIGACHRLAGLSATLGECFCVPVRSDLAERSDRRPCGPWQDYAGRRHALAVGGVPRRPGCRRSGCWTRWTWSARRASRFSPRTPPYGTGWRTVGTSPSTSSTRRATPTSAARSSAAWTMVDGVLLLVDASEGPLPQTRFVLRKALEARAADHPGDQQGRPAATLASQRSSTRPTSCSSTSTRDEDADSTSRSCTPARASRSRLADRARRRRDARTARPRPLFATLLRAPSRRPVLHRGAPLQAHRDQPRRLAVPRAASRSAGYAQGTHPPRPDRSPGAAPTARSAACKHLRAVDDRGAWSAEPAESGRAGRHHRRRRHPRDHDRRDARRRQTTRDPLPVITVDEPSISMTIGINTSPLAGQVRATSSPRGW